MWMESAAVTICTLAGKAAANKIGKQRKNR